jgi:hypothetical protein
MVNGAVRIKAGADEMGRHLGSQALARMETGRTGWCGAASLWCGWRRRRHL